jgi:hypothetical protein
MKSFRMLSVLLAGLLITAVAFSQEQQMSHKQQAPSQGTAKGAMQGNKQGNMMDQCKSVMQMRQKMLSDMKSADAELGKLAGEMNSAPESKKLDAMAAVINKMVEQRRAMDEKMPEMQIKMMQHLMGHMEAGKESISMCPMMKQMKQSGGTSKDEHAAHHQ